MLDALMGPGRDVAGKDPKAQDWKERTVCKGYLIGFCPYDKAVLGGKRNLEVCSKIHSEILRSKFEAHADGASTSEFRKKCEDISLRDLEYVIGECDSHARREMERLKKEPKPRRLPADANFQIFLMKKQRTEIMTKAELLEDCDARQKEQLIKQAEQLMADAEAYQKEEERKVAESAPRPQTCEVCGTAYTGDEERDNHLRYKVHEGYISVRDRLQELKQKRSDREAEEKEKREQDRKRKNEEHIKKAEDEDKNDKDKDAGKDDENSDDAKKKDKKDAEKERDRSKERGNRSRERGKDRKGSRSRDRRERERERERGDRDRKGNARSSSRGRGRGRDRGRSRSRSRSRRRNRSGSRRRR